MKYYSINNKSEVVDFADAIVLGQARDGGLYFPEKIPVLMTSDHCCRPRIMTG